eukprot:TRINITY_DN5440_c0_g1_i1.p1 TRINITY_DN5440_c0_g1~~TRINITY_DN5440_c0_g1_i1.p1  ORF type:complete len:1320 (-),score=231.72 TRINITY_DN5440_c0_g1_i1:184-4143(-)
MEEKATGSFHFRLPLSSPVKPGVSAGIAVVLSQNDYGKNAKRSSILSNAPEENEKRELQRTLGHIFDVPITSLPQLDGCFHPDIVPAILEEGLKQFYTDSESNKRSGISIFETRHGKNVVRMDEGCSGGMKFFNDFLLLESQAMFSSARANACVWKGKWMYEVTLETAGIQQLGWATLACPFTQNEGVGDDEGSYAYDGRRMRKWNKDPRSYGQSWVAGDVIGCCIDLDENEISFYRNGVSLGVAFYGVREPVSGYFPAVSLSQGERSEVNFGSRPFKYPVEGFLPLQAPPVVRSGERQALVSELASYFLSCLSRLVKLYCYDIGTSASVDKMRIFKRCAAFHDLFHPVGQEICKQFFSSLNGGGMEAKEYVVWGTLVPFLLEIFGSQYPHDGSCLDKVVDLIMSFSVFSDLILPIIQALAYNCKTSKVSLVHCPYTGSYPYLALACHILKREEIMLHWWKSSQFDHIMEGLLSRKRPNKQDLHDLMPVVWWTGCQEGLSSEKNMKQTTLALTEAIEKVEEMQFELCRILISFNPSSRHSRSQGLVFRTFLDNLIWKNKGAERNILPLDLSNNSVLVSAFTVLLRFLSDGFGMGNILESIECQRQTIGNGVGFLHRDGKRSFPVALFLKADSHGMDFSRLGGTFNHLVKNRQINDEELEEIQWDEGCMELEENIVTHSSRQKPCCCSYTASSYSSTEKSFLKAISKCSSSHDNSIQDRATGNTECPSRGYSTNVDDKASTSEHTGSEILYQLVPIQGEAGSQLTQVFGSALREEELFDIMVLLYHLGVAPNFKQASYYLSHMSHSIALLDDTDVQIRAENSSSEHLRRLKDARNVYREDLVDCVRQCAWYRVTLLSRWKQRGMYATCMWLSQLLLLLSKKENIFLYVPEFYVETLVDCFHALRRSDPPFVSPAAFLAQGLSSFVTFLVKHFDDSRIANADLRDVLLQSISVLVQYKEFTVAFETNKTAIQRMPGALLRSFDNRFWIPITNILLRLCKGSGFGASKYSESWSKYFQVLLREKCMLDEKLFACFLNRLFNTLSWTVTEFSVSLKEMQEHPQLQDLQQKKCAIIFELLCNLARLLELFTCEVPQAFLCGPATNMIRLAELTVFVLSLTTSSAEAELFDNMLMQQGQSLEKVNRAMILAPVVGMILNLSKKEAASPQKLQNSLLQALTCMNSLTTIRLNLQYLLEFNWVGFFKGDPSLVRLWELKSFLQKLNTLSQEDVRVPIPDQEDDEEVCCICYSSKIDTIFVPCNHQSCLQCISRHLLNNQRCFFCNAVVTEVCSMSCVLAPDENTYRTPGAKNALVAEGGPLIKPESV